MDNREFIDNLFIKDDENIIVLKIGSSLLLDKENNYQVRKEWILSLAKDIKNLIKNNKKIVIVSSGAVGLGRKILNLGSNIDIEEKQAAASVGQISLISAWKEVLESQNITTAQILLSYNDTEDAKSRQNIQKTISKLIENNIVPIINENDSTGTEELKYGDNDRMAARVAKLAHASDLLLLTDTDGLYTRDPVKFKDAKFIENIKNFNDDDYFAFATGSSTTVGTGGMKTKLTAGFMAKLCGINTIIARGNIENPIQNLIENKTATIIHKGIPLEEHDIWDLAFLDYEKNNVEFNCEIQYFACDLSDNILRYHTMNGINPYKDERIAMMSIILNHYVKDILGNKFLCKYYISNEHQHTYIYAAYDLKKY